MKTVIIFVIVLLALTACTPTQTPVVTEAASTDIPAAGLPNPASVNCIEKGNKNEIITADDGSQSGICIFPDGSSCDEWAYFRGECGPSVQNNPIPVVTVEPTSNGDNSVQETDSWIGVIKSTDEGAQFDDYFESKDSGQVKSFGIDSIDTEVKAQIESLRDTGKVIHIYGTLITDIPDYNGSQIQVDRIEVEEK